MLRSRTSLVLVAIALCALNAGAQVPRRLGYQGRLLTAAGAPVTGQTQVTFALFSAATGGTALWTETQTLGLSDGYYSTHLGDATPSGCSVSAGSCTGVPASVFDGTERYLELTVGSSVLSPRQSVGSVAYAYLAGAVRGPVDATSVQINGTTVIDGNGRLVGPAGYSAGAGLSLDAGAFSVQFGTTSTTAAAGDDARFTNARAPTGAAGGELSGTYPNPTVVAVSANTNGAIVRRDGSGNFSAGTITANLTGNATNVTGVVAIANGGTGSTTAPTARTALGLGDVATLNTPGNTTTFLRGDGTFAAASVTFPACNNTGAPESSSNKPCLARVYRCPQSFTANGVASGLWASYGCVGQMWLSPTCIVTVNPETQVYACSFVGSTPLF